MFHLATAGWTACALMGHLALLPTSAESFPDHSHTALSWTRDREMAAGQGGVIALHQRTLFFLLTASHVSTTDQNPLFSYFVSNWIFCFPFFCVDCYFADP